MQVFDLSDSKLLPGNFFSIAAKQPRTRYGVSIDFRPNGSSFDLKAPLGFSFK